jgi:hypothetical protein
LDGDEHANFFRNRARRRHAFSGIFVVNPLKLGVGGDLPKIKNLNQKMCSKGPKIPFFGSHLSAFSHLSNPSEFRHIRPDIALIAAFCRGTSQQRLVELANHSVPILGTTFGADL